MFYKADLESPIVRDDPVAEKNKAKGNMGKWCHFETKKKSNRKFKFILQLNTSKYLDYQLNINSSLISFTALLFYGNCAFTFN